MADRVLELRRLAREAREKIEASGVGMLHAHWDIVFDAEDICAGRTGSLSLDNTASELRKFIKGAPDHAN